MAEPNYRELSKALRQALARPTLASKLMSDETAPQAMKELDISSEEIRVEIINLLKDIEAHRSTEIQHSEESGGSSDLQSREMRSAHDFFDHSFSQLRLAYRLSTGMSSVMFLVGLGFLVIAAIRVFTQPGNVASTSVIGGIGIVQIVLLFYRNPLADIARAVSHSQEAKLAILSFLMAVELLNRQVGEGQPSTEHLRSLADLTDRALRQLEVCADQPRPEVERKRGFQHPSATRLAMTAHSRSGRANSSTTTDSQDTSAAT